ncbi:MAG TPA: NUDIX domain-containing protein [Caldilineae bacterium]|nr:NUDIX domain-containing protein [Caldilineae bacterium]
MTNPYGVDPSRFTLIPRVLVIATREEEVLLLRRAEHKRLWPGLYNAPGGHVERGETPVEAAVRELAEETGLRASRLELRGLLIGDAVGELPGVILFIYHAQVSGELHARNPEGVPHWIPRAQLPHIPTLPDLPLILRHVLDQSAFFTLYKTPRADGSEDVRIIMDDEKSLLNLDV